MNRIIIKADDFWGRGHKEESSFIDFVINKKIKISLGIVGKGLETSSRDITDVLCANNHVIEPFNHSYWHIVSNPVKEFYKTDIIYQENSIEFTQDIISKRLLFKPSTIGFPANACDDNTLIVLDSSFPEIKNIYYTAGAYNYDKVASLGKKIIDIDQENVIQIHPFTPEFNLEEFKQLVVSKIDSGYEFIWPSDL